MFDQDFRVFDTEDFCHDRQGLPIEATHHAPRPIGDIESIRRRAWLDMLGDQRAIQPVAQFFERASFCVM